MEFLIAAHEFLGVDLGKIDLVTVRIAEIGNEVCRAVLSD